MARKVTSLDYADRVHKVHGSKIKVLSFTGFGGSASYKCTKCSHTWTTKGASNVLYNKSGCPKCKASLIRDKTAWVCSNSAYRLKLAKVNPTIDVDTDADLLGKYKKIGHLCLICGHKWETLPSTALRGVGCPSKTCISEKIHIKKTRTTSEFREVLLQKRGKSIKLVGQYRTGRKLRFKCYTCLNSWKSVPNNVLAGTGCPYCANVTRSGNLKRSAKFKTILVDGYSIKVQGYEPQALDWILNKFPKLKVSDIAFDTSGDVPVVDYKLGRRNHVYYPDMFIQKQNRVIEVKSTYTLGITSSRGWKKNQEKAKACISQGFKFSLLLMNSDGTRLWLPKNWYNLSKREVLTQVAYHYGTNSTNSKPTRVFLQ